MKSYWKICDEIWVSHKVMVDVFYNKILTTTLGVTANTKFNKNRSISLRDETWGLTEHKKETLTQALSFRLHFMNCGLTEQYKTRSQPETNFSRVYINMDPILTKLTPLLIDSVQLNSSSETNGNMAGQDVAHILRNQVVHYLFHNRLLWYILWAK
jgi:hypothetical protein